MNSAVHKLSKEIGINEKELVTAGVKAYVRFELGKIEAKLHALYHKYNIKSIKDLEHAIEKGEVVESDVFEDLTRIDYLEAEKTKLRRLIRTV
ncbi:MAG: hypothetical protein KKD46_00790 [Euryarchaeota archaeon]|nr:hypothetical protein [Euryarchaeota archaeon]MBU4339446.1 hypothetical protein [Euryarchaeota archaeon]MCG2737814.1 hypothetical protein [Candidatus Methanoperedenaceae archaeon]